jgi:hypothetical protein
VEIDYLEEQDGQLNTYEFKWQGKAKMPLAFANGYPGSTFEVVDSDNFEGFVGGNLIHREGYAKRSSKNFLKEIKCAE